MNLHGIVRGAITTVNPDIDAVYLRSLMYTTDAAGIQTPSYAPPEVARIQVQALSAKDLQQIAHLNIEGVLRAVYMYGNTQGVVRQDVKGGDLLQFPETPADLISKDWLVVQVFETWPDWSKVAVWQQLAQN